MTVNNAYSVAACSISYQSAVCWAWSDWIKADATPICVSLGESRHRRHCDYCMPGGKYIYSWNYCWEHRQRLECHWLFDISTMYCMCICSAAWSSMRMIFPAGAKFKARVRQNNSRLELKLDLLSFWSSDLRQFAVSHKPRRRTAFHLLRIL